MGENKIQDFLDEIKAQGKASPTGMYWNDFYLFLKRSKLTGEGNPPVPLILAASGESPASKQSRLEEQLSWALRNNCLDQAIEFLVNLEDHKWVTSPESRWNKDTYWTPD